MTRIDLIELSNASGAAAEQLAAAKKKLGGLPNFAKAMANSPATLKAYLSMYGALQEGVLSAGTKERIALAVAEFNGCNYCVSAHVELARSLVKLSDDDVDAARRGTSSDPKEAALVGLAVEAARSRGHLGADSIADARSAGVTDEEMVEVIGNVIFSSLTNYLNEAFDVDIDWPVAPALQAVSQ
ncbi:carboxymuconolactone decarboxylase family protein [Rhodococcus sp. MEB064]|uniref:carboxymuconolactone decarboxylase family protein n=1 Tax=Rhodococcus sp. MEB064 TaxID=1587522 RepID=UPI0005ABD1F8|nr:carboxymuconolactone decarboxylase family protein [Rhodococcus sp. MEB064]KIQ08024.1 hypothetical protein RU01_21750 [Rhodococcus sp. MEB064]